MGKSTRPARYNLNQIPHEYIVEVINRFKGFNLVNKVPEELWTEVCNIVEEILKKKESKKVKWLFVGALQIAEERREVKRKGERERHTQLNAVFQRISRRGKKVFFYEQ